MRNSFLQGILGAALLCTTAVATAEVAGNITFATDYRFRGISQTDRDPAVQGGFDWASESGIYLGTWASNIQFGGSIEMDFYGGFKGTIGEDLSYDIGYIYYAYPSANEGPDDNDLDYQEVKAALSFIGFTVGANYSPDYTLESGAFWYLFADYSLPLGEVASLGFHVALNQWEDEEDFATFGLGDGDDDDDAYIDYFVKLSTTQLGLTWALAYVGTDLDEEECFNSKICDPMAVVTVTKSL